MQIDTSASFNGNPVPEDVAGTALDAPDLRVFVFGLFFVFGGITSLNDILIPKLKELFDLSHAQSMLIQSAFFAAYAIVSIPAAAIVRRFGYMRGATIGLLAMMAGCLLFIPASATARFELFLAALFVLASGVTIIQVVANPLISLLGPPASAPSRLTFAQGFNSLGTTIFPYVGSILILGSLATVDADTLSGVALDSYRATETHTIVTTYLGLAAILAIIAGVVWLRRNRLREACESGGNPLAALTLLRRPRFAFGAACIFLYVGAEVSIGSLIVNYLSLADTMAISEQAAGKHVAFYWGGALVGRFAGAAMLRLVTPGRVLTGAAMTAIMLILLSANTVGSLSGWLLLAIGLANSIMFPTIFALACAGLGVRAAEGSGLICVAIVGGAIIPPLTGQLADVSNSLKFALLLPAICYAAIASYGVYARRSPA